MSWELIKERLRTMVPDNTVDLWVSPLSCRQESEEIIDLVAPDRFFSSWVQENILPMIKQCLTELNLTAQIKLTVAGGQDETAPVETRKQLPLPTLAVNKSTVRTLHPRFTFDEFMVGESNIMARSVCEALANNDKSMGHCLFLDSGPGLGKSHLTHAVAHKILAESPGTRLHYLTAQQLTAEMVKNIRNNTMEEFKDKYHHHCDVLLIEDIHTLSGRSKTQEELSSALDTLLKQEKRVIFTSKVPPRNIQDIEPEFRSRLSGGLLATINPPDLRTRTHIIRRKAGNYQLDLDDEIIGFLAGNLKGDIRRVESAIVGLKARIGIMGCQPTLGLVKEIITNLLGEENSIISAAAIRDFVARQFDTPVEELLSKSRKRTVAFPRQIAMYLTRKLTSEPLNDIGRSFNRDHSTVVHAIRVISEAINRSGSVRGQIELLTDKIQRELC